MMQKCADDRQQTWEQVIRDIDKVLLGKAPVTKITTIKKALSQGKSNTRSNTLVRQQKKSAVKPASEGGESKNIAPSCPACGAVNRVDALFCVKCGGSLSRKCPECSENMSIYMNFCSKCGADIKTMFQLENMLQQIRNEKEQGHWDQIIKLSASLPEKSQLSGKKSPRFLTEIIKIKTEAEKLVNMETAYNKANELAKKYTDENNNIEALKALQNFLNEYPKSDYGPELKHRINKLKKVSYQGPETGQEWLIPDSQVTMIPINAGVFTMGSPAGTFLGIGAEKGRRSNEGPQHQVTLSQPFWMGKYPVTIGDYLNFLNSSDNTGEIRWTPDSCPVEQAGRNKEKGHECRQDMHQPMVEINWVDASNFCKWLTQRELKYNRLPDGFLYRLPTEAEWEYCCRAGTASAFFFGPTDSRICDYAWYKSNSQSHSHPVDEKKPNAWGLHDMIGNVWEWCQDKYGDYSDIPVTDPYGSSAGIGYVRRGGSWINNTDHCRSACRNFWEAKCAFNYLGFRIVLAPTKIRMFGTQY